MALRDIKRAARRDLHNAMRVPAYFLRTRDAVPLLVHVRVWDYFNQTGDIKGSRTYPAEVENASPKLRFDRVEIAAMPRLSIVSVDAGEAYLVDHTLPTDDEFQTVDVTRMTAADAAGLPFPPVGTP